MISEPPRVVYDCNILFQSIISTKGPSHRCTQLATEGRVMLFISEYLFSEIRDISTRPLLREKFRLDSHKIEAFLADVRKFAVRVEIVPGVYQHPSDPKDSHYVNLAFAADAKLVVSRDNHLLCLNDPRHPVGRDFLRRFPGHRILEPVSFLEEVDRVAP